MVKIPSKKAEKKDQKPICRIERTNGCAVRTDIEDGGDLFAGGGQVNRI